MVLRQEEKIWYSRISGNQFYTVVIKMRGSVFAITWNGNDRDGLTWYHSGWAAVFHIKMGIIDTVPDREKKKSYIVNMSIKTMV